MSDFVKIDGCVNCGVCMQVCSMHHTGVFSYGHASIGIQRSGEDMVAFFREPISCDVCEGEGWIVYTKLDRFYRAIYTETKKQKTRRQVDTNDTKT